MQTSLALCSCLEDAHTILDGSGDLFQWAERLAEDGNLLIKFWLETPKFEIKIIIFIRSIRVSSFLDGDFSVRTSVRLCSDRVKSKF